MIPPAATPATQGVVLHHASTVYDLLAPAMLLFCEGEMNRRAARLLELNRCDQVLDVGCATGRTTLAVAHCLDARRGGLAVGVDASPQMIRLARRKIRRQPCRFDLAAAESLPYGDSVFDKAVSTMFFHHLAGADKLRALREVGRVLRPGGLFVVVDVDIPTTLFGRLCASSGRWLFQQPELGENIAGVLPALFEEAGFTFRRVASDLGYISTFVLKRRMAETGR